MYSGNVSTTLSRHMDKRNACSNQFDSESDPSLDRYGKYTQRTVLPEQTRMKRELTPTPTRPLHDDAHVFVVFCDAQDVHDGRFAARFERDVTNPTLRTRCLLVC